MENFYLWSHRMFSYVKPPLASLFIAQFKLHRLGNGGVDYDTNTSALIYITTIKIIPS